MPYVAQLIDAINACAERWFYLDLHIPKRFMQRMQSTGRQLPMMHTLKLQTVVDCLTPNWDLHFKYEDKIDFGQIPNLQRIYVLEPNLHQINFNWKDLTYVEVDAFTPVMCMVLLPAATFLTHLIIRKTYRTSYVTYYPIFLHCNLVSREVMGLCVSDFLSSLNLPALVHLGAEVDSVEPPTSEIIRALLERSSCSLKSFYLKSTYIPIGETTDKVMNVVRSLPSSVQTLRLSCSYYESSSSQLRTTTNPKVKQIMSNTDTFLPCLKNLRIISNFRDWNCVLDLSYQTNCSRFISPEGIGLLYTLPYTTRSETELQLRHEHLTYLVDFDVQKKLEPVLDSNFSVKPPQELNLTPLFMEFLRRSLYQYKYYIHPPA
ncbi:hypothetical protein BDN70DRAFT_134254 [Pholiota conissans]|uniref:Uncharacterized protein n=1 Tax=Pholiota conissans TaxID=109636 RepID=A0A9P6CY94_9AGAR|nr:hypothetical protein BDN70DRAFT_134254 [Pholiota conissans]